MNLQDIYKPIAKKLAIVESRLLAKGRGAGSPIFKTIGPLLNTDGKRLRPALLLLAAKVCGAEGGRAIDLAVVIELIHLASLIHDDVIDNADLRRNVRSINSRWGNKISILTGDYLISLAMDLLVEHANPRVMRAVTAALRAMVTGEITQTLALHPLEMTEARYFSIIAGKTAVLTACACRVGAMLRKSRHDESETLGQYGFNLGMAFQITDDVLDVIGNPRELGKFARNDIREKTLTLPFIRAMSIARKKDGEWMRNTFNHGPLNERALARMVRMVREYGGIEYSLAKVKHYSDACRRHLNVLDESESRRSLALLADYIAGRAHYTLTAP